MLMSDLPLGALVSGGLDSSLMAREAALMSPDLSLFTVDVVGANSEILHARLLAEVTGRPLHETRFLPDQMISTWSQLTFHYEYPLIYHPSVFPLASVMRLVRSLGVKSVLTGEGADELFLGYPSLLDSRFPQTSSPYPNTSELLNRSAASMLHREARSPIDSFVTSLAGGFENERLWSQAQAAWSFLPLMLHVGRPSQLPSYPAI